MSVWRYLMDVRRGKIKPVPPGTPVPGTGKIRLKYNSRDDWSLGDKLHDPFNRARRERAARRHEDRAN